jgi:sugar phosphate isomerase/epimerase
MRHALSTHLFANHRLTTSLLERIQSAGIEAVEIFCAKQHLDWYNTEQIGELKYWFRDSELELWSLHSPMYTDEIWGRSGPQSVVTITEPTKAKRIAMVDEVKRVLEIAETVPFRYLIQHIGVGGEEYDERKVDAAFNSLEEIGIFARQRGVNVLLENIPNKLSSAIALNSFLDMTHLDLSFCFDVGHAHMNEGIEPAYEAMRKRIRSTHIHDNDGVEDSHLFPMHSEGGTIDWRQAMQLLASRPEQYPLVLELKEVSDMEFPLDVVRKVFDSLDQASEEEEER